MPTGPGAEVIRGPTDSPCAALETLEQRQLLSGYSITDLGTLGGSSSSATAINASGDVVGTASLAGNAASHAVLWSSGQATDLGTLGGNYSTALGINSVGDIVGKADSSSQSNLPFLIQSGGSMSDLMTVPTSYSYILTANAISDTGVIVGLGDIFKGIPAPATPLAEAPGSGLNVINATSSNFIKNGYAYDYHNQTLSEIGDSNQGQNEFYAITGATAVGVSSTTTSLQQQAVTADVQTRVSQNLPTFGGDTSTDAYGAATSADGQTTYVVGSHYGSPNGLAAALWTITSGGTSISPLSSGSVAEAVNSAGTVVGYDTNVDLAWVWTSANGTGTLNSLIPPSSGWNLQRATGINNNGWICGTGVINGVSHAFLLKPDTTPPTASLGSHPNVVTAGGNSYTVTVTYKDHLGIDASTLGNSNLVITGPGGSLQTSSVSSISGNPTSITATYSITPPSGWWDLSDNGTYSIRLQSNSVRNTSGTAVAGGTLGTFAVSIPQTGPFFGSPAPFGRIQAENFDYGGQNVADYNPTNYNQGGYYRPTENVGIGVNPGGAGGYAVGYMSPGEWVDYTVAVATTDTYTLNFRVAAGVPGCAFHLSVDGVNVTGSLAIPNNGWDTYQIVSKTGIHLTAGTHLLRLAIDSKNPTQGNGNFDWFEAIEAPSVGSIQGTVFYDTNLNGAQNPGESPLANRYVYVDLNHDGVWQANEPIAATDATGHYVIGNLAPGSYTVDTYLPPGVRQVTNGGAGLPVTVTSGTTSVANFGEVDLSGSITGTVFNDLNHDHIFNNGEPGLNGVKVFLDHNANGKLDAGELQTTTDVNGNYSFANVPVGTYQVTEVTPSGLVATPASAFIAVTISAGQTLAGVNFADGVPTTAGISGHIYDDFNGNRVNETPLGGWVVYIDLNHDGTLDSGDPTTTTDSSGAYSFTGLAAGTYRVRDIPPGAGQFDACDSHSVVGIL